MHLALGAGLDYEIGSPGGTHGRLYMTLQHEARTAPVSADEYERLRLLAGVALVH